MKIDASSPVVGGAGGAGSIAIQLARKLTGLTVNATASRPETEASVRELGAHHVIDHSSGLVAGLKAIAFPAVAIVAASTGTARHVGAVGLIAG